MKTDSPLVEMYNRLKGVLGRVVARIRVNKRTKRYKIIMLWSGGKFRFRYKVRIYDVLEWHYVRQLKHDIAMGKISLD